MYVMVCPSVGDLTNGFVDGGPRFKAGLVGMGAVGGLREGWECFAWAMFLRSVCAALQS